MAKNDVIVIGSGFGGSIPACRLAQDGRKVLVLEWGERFDPEDLEQSWSVRYFQKVYNVLYTADYGVIFRYARCLGGGSVMFSGAMLRMPSDAVEYVNPGGYRLWPKEVTRALLDPYYDRVEQMMKITQARWDEVPRSGARFARLFDALGKTCDRGRFNYVDCLQCGYCEAGCVFGRKQTLLMNYIPEASKKGAEFRTGCDVRTIEALSSQKGYRVTYRDRYGGVYSEEAPLVVVACGAIETAALLLRSRKYLPQMSDQVGKNLHNNGDLHWQWMLPESEADPRQHVYMGRTNAVMISYAYWKSHQISIHTGCFPPSIVAGLEVYRRKGEPHLPWGLAHKNWMKAIYENRMVTALAIGPTTGEGEIQIDKEGNPRVLFPLSESYRQHTKKVIGVAEEIARGSGAEVLYTGPNGSYDRGGAHMMATVRMAHDAKDGGCDIYGELFGCPGLFVSDASAIPGSTGVNPALTIAANAERIADQIVKRGKG